MTLLPGTTLGRYQILEPLGQGGMAVVYKAYQPALDRTVALKVIRRGFAEDAEFRERFAREAKAVARLTHPHIVQVFDYDEAAGELFLAMQYLQGGTLKAKLVALAEAGAALAEDETLRILGQVSDALEYAHRREVVHRDVKPANVMLTEDGSAVVTDFGIAKIIGGTSHTQTGVGIGTPEYMSPEQGQALPLDGRADQYSLAVMAFEMLTGRLPYTADTPLAIVLKHLRDPLPLPSSLRPDLGPAVDRVLLRALAKEPADRFAGTGAFVAALTAALRERPGRTLPTVVRRAPTHADATATASATVIRPLPLATLSSRPLVLIAAALALLVVGGGGVTVLGAFGRGAPEPSLTTNVAAATTAPPTPTPTSVTPPTASPTPTSTPTPTVTPTATPTPTAIPSRPTVTTPPPTPIVATCDTSAAAAIYGSVKWGPTAVAGARIEVRSAGALKAAGTTGGDGSYRVCGIPAGQDGFEISVVQAPYRPYVTGYSGLSVGQEKYVSDIYLIRTITGISTATNAIVAPGPHTLTWDAVPSATSYRIAFASGPVYASRCDFWAPFATDAKTTVPARSYTTPALSAGTLYKVLVAAFNGALQVGEGSVCFSSG